MFVTYKDSRRLESYNLGAEELGLRATKICFSCEGISTRQEYLSDHSRYIQIDQVVTSYEHRGERLTVRYLSRVAAAVR